MNSTLCKIDKDCKFVRSTFSFCSQFSSIDEQFQSNDIFPRELHWWSNQLDIERNLILRGLKWSHLGQCSITVSTNISLLQRNSRIFIMLIHSMISVRKGYINESFELANKCNIRCKKVNFIVSLSNKQNLHNSIAKIWELYYFKET